MNRFAATEIVPEGEILTNDMILDENIILKHINRLENNLEVIKWLARRGLLRNRVVCLDCNELMRFVRRGDIRDKFMWKCRTCSKRCSIRAESFFSNSHLTLEQILIIMYCWTYDYAQNITSREAELGPASTHTIIDWNNFCREICEAHLIANPTVIGGLNDDLSSKVVEVDESKFFHRKYHRGQWREGHWVFGGIERGTGNCFLVEVPNRNQETLGNIIQEYILPGTLIMSDGWRGYNNIEELGGGIYEHQVIIHEENFVNPEDVNIHTQTVENMWMRAKRKLRRQFGTSESLFTSYLHEFLWRNKFRDSNLFGNFILAIKQEYPIQN